MLCEHEHHADPGEGLPISGRGHSADDFAVLHRDETAARFQPKQTPPILERLVPSRKPTQLIGRRQVDVGHPPQKDLVLVLLIAENIQSKEEVAEKFGERLEALRISGKENHMVNFVSFNMHENCNTIPML